MKTVACASPAPVRCDQLAALRSLAALCAALNQAADDSPLPRTLVDRCACWLMALRRRRRAPWTSARTALLSALWRRVPPPSALAERSQPLWGNIYVLSFVRQGGAWRLEIW